MIEKKIKLKILVSLPLFFFIGILYGLGIFSGFNITQKFQNEFTISILTSGYHIPISLIHQFEEKYKAKVTIMSIDDPSEFTELLDDSLTSFDLVVFSSNKLDHMLGQKWFRSLHHHLIPNMKNISPDFLTTKLQSNFIIPLQWSLSGIVMDTHYIEDEEITWNGAMLDNSYHNKIALFIDSDEILDLLIKLERIDPQWFKQTSEYKKISEALISFTKFLKFDKNPCSKLGHGDIWIAQCFHSEAIQITKNSRFKFIIPEDGSNLRFDFIGIPKKSKLDNKDYQFIDFMLEKSSALQLINTNQQATTNLLLNDLPINEFLKAHFFRKVPIHKMKIPIFRGKEINQWNQIFSQFIIKNH